MLYQNNIRILQLLSLLLFAIVAKAADLRGKIYDQSNNSGIPYAIIILTDSQGTRYHSTADVEGHYLISSLPDGSYHLEISYIGYKKVAQTVSITSSATLNIPMQPDAQMLNEVVVTAKEGQGITSTSIIDRQAIEHLQPSSFTDLLALLPGGSSSLPSLTSANSIHLRQAGAGGSDYDISSMGTMFVTDGIPMNSNANMQKVTQASNGAYGDPDGGRDHTTTGVDMRTIPTDNIESVEIIRGIAPVEYGDLTSGVVLIQRKLKATPYEARFKADSYSKLLYAGKGFEWGRLIANFGLDYLDAKADPRNPLTSYERLTMSARLQYTWSMKRFNLRWKSNIDYTGSFDNDKYDPELLKQKDDRYRSTYNRMSMSHSLLLTPVKSSFFKSLNFDISAAYESDEIKQDKRVILSRDIAVSIVLDEGEHDGAYLPYQYMSHVRVDGRPLNLYAKMKALFEGATGPFTHRINTGVEWKMDKNYGDGQVYDPAFPVTPGTSYRPRVYHQIPADHHLSFFAQDELRWVAGPHQFVLSAGLRSMQLLHLASEYKMSGTVYIDPRFNVQWRLPQIAIGKHALVIDLNGGWGRQTKTPTLLQIYPDKIYTDLVELNYYHLNEAYRRLYLQTYVINPVNYRLTPARNDKWEVRLGASYDGHHFSLTYFRETLNSGFRTSTTVRPYGYKDYDESFIDGNLLTDKPDLRTLPYEEKTRLGLYGSTTNGSRLVKEGVEYQLSTKRYDAIKTRFTLNGAWFKTTYANSEPMYRSVTTAVVDGTPVNDMYMGFYDSSEGYVREQLNTNLMADTYLPRLGLAFSVTAECTWYYSSQSMRENGVPIAYMSTDGNVYPYGEDDKSDTYRQWLVQKYNESAYVKQKVPFWAFLNVKVTKDFGRHMKLALFINRMLDYMPDYTSASGLKVRRTSKPYFGMEMNIKI